MLHALLRAIDDARGADRLDVLSRSIWADHAAGRIDDDTAQRLAEAVQGRRNGLRDSRTSGFASVGQIKRLFPAKRRQRAPERSVLIERRRTNAASGWMPPATASRFTVGEQAVLSVIAREVMTKGACELCVDALAALAGVSRRLVQAATRLATQVGLLCVEMRPVRGARHKPNRITILDSGWRAWLSRRHGGCKSSHPMSTRYSQPSVVAAVQTVNQAYGEADRVPAVPSRDSWADPSRGSRAMR